MRHSVDISTCKHVAFSVRCCVYDHWCAVCEEKEEETACQFIQVSIRCSFQASVEMCRWTTVFLQVSSYTSHCMPTQQTCSLLCFAGNYSFSDKASFTAVCYVTHVGAFGQSVERFVILLQCTTLTDTIMLVAIFHTCHWSWAQQSCT